MSERFAVSGNGTITDKERPRVVDGEVGESYFHDKPKATEDGKELALLIPRQRESAEDDSEVVDDTEVVEGEWEDGEPVRVNEEDIVDAEVVEDEEEAADGTSRKDRRRKRAQTGGESKGRGPEMLTDETLPELRRYKDGQGSFKFDQAGQKLEWGGNAYTDRATDGRDEEQTIIITNSEGKKFAVGQSIITEIPENNGDNVEFDVTPKALPTIEIGKEWTVLGESYGEITGIEVKYEQFPEGEDNITEIDEENPFHYASTKISNAIEAIQNGKEPEEPGKKERFARLKKITKTFRSKFNRLDEKANMLLYKHRKTIGALGAIALAYGLYKMGGNVLDAFDGSGTGVAEAASAPDTTPSYGDENREPGVIGGAEAPAAPEAPDFSEDARTIDRGEGWFNTFNELGIDESQHEELLDKVGDQLVDKGVAYEAPELGGYGMELGDGRLSDEVLQTITDAANGEQASGVNGAESAVETTAGAEAADSAVNTEVPTDAEIGYSANNEYGANLEATGYIEPNEGLSDVAREMGIPSADRATLLEAAGPDLADRGFAYRSGSIEGGYGLNMTADGKMPEEALRILTDTADRLGIRMVHRF